MFLSLGTPSQTVFALKELLSQKKLLTKNALVEGYGKALLTLLDTP
jgi:hypothetical protein